MSDQPAQQEIAVKCEVCGTSYYGDMCDGKVKSKMPFLHIPGYIEVSPSWSADMPEYAIPRRG